MIGQSVYQGAQTEEAVSMSYYSTLQRYLNLEPMAEELALFVYRL